MKSSNLNLPTFSTFFPAAVFFWGKACQSGGRLLLYLGSTDEGVGRLLFAQSGRNKGRFFPLSVMFLRQKMGPEHLHHVFCCEEWYNEVSFWGGLGEDWSVPQCQLYIFWRIEMLG